MPLPSCGAKMSELTPLEHAERASSILTHSERAASSLRAEHGPGQPGRSDSARRILSEGATLAQAHSLTALALIVANEALRGEEWAGGEQ